MESRSAAPPPKPSAAQAVQWWRAGYLGWLLTPTGQRLRRQYWAARKAGIGELVWDLSRRLSKTRTMLACAHEVCLREQGARVPFAAKTQKEVRQVIRPMLRDFYALLPDAERPVERWSEGLIYFPRTKSEIVIAGCDNGHYDALRGNFASAWFFDEAAFGSPEDFGEIIDDVLRPQTWTTRGTGVIASTPPTTPAHPFQMRYLVAKAEGRSSYCDFWSGEIVDRHTGRYLTHEEKERLVADHARSKGLSLAEFKLSTTYLREYMGEFVTDSERAIIPEFTEAREARLCHAPGQTEHGPARPLWADRYLVGDTGGGAHDYTGLLASSYDFARGKLLFLGERLLRQPSTREVAAGATALAAEVFPPEGGGMPGTEDFRFLDATKFMLRDLANDHDLVFAQTAKDDRDAAVMAARDWVAQERIEIVGCPQLRAQLRAGIWNKSRTDFERVVGFGHFDLVAAYVYTVRNVLPNINRLPQHHGVNREEVFVPPPEEHESDAFGGLLE